MAPTIDFKNYDCSSTELEKKRSPAAPPLQKKSGSETWNSPILIIARQLSSRHSPKQEKMSKGYEHVIGSRSQAEFEDGKKLSNTSPKPAAATMRNSKYIPHAPNRLDGFVNVCQIELRPNLMHVNVTITTSIKADKIMHADGSEATEEIHSTPGKNIDEKAPMQLEVGDQEKFAEAHAKTNVDDTVQHNHLEDGSHTHTHTQKNTETQVEDDGSLVESRQSLPQTSMGPCVELSPDTKDRSTLALEQPGTGTNKTQLIPRENCMIDPKQNCDDDTTEDCVSNTERFPDLLKEKCVEPVRNPPQNRPQKETIMFVKTACKSENHGKELTIAKEQPLQNQRNDEQQSLVNLSAKDEGDYSKAVSLKHLARASKVVSALGQNARQVIPLQLFYDPVLFSSPPQER